jgi:hypothetical protein
MKRRNKMFLKITDLMTKKNRLINTDQIVKIDEFYNSKEKKIYVKIYFIDKSMVLSDETVEYFEKILGKKLI